MHSQKSDLDTTLHGAVGFGLASYSKAELLEFVFDHMSPKGRLLGPKGAGIPLSLL